MIGYPHNVKVGDELVVVDDSPFQTMLWSRMGFFQEPCDFTKGEVVKVVGIYTGDLGVAPEGPYFFILSKSRSDIPVRYKRFKPVQKSKPDISVFKSILSNSHKKLECA